MSQTAWSLVVWGAWLALFLALELLGYFRVGPWITLSETVWGLEMKYRLIALFVAGGLFMLILHLAFRWPERFPG